jgi:hypothetical protein
MFITERRRRRPHRRQTPRLCASAECSSPAATASDSVASPHRPRHHDQEGASKKVRARR